MGCHRCRTGSSARGMAAPLSGRPGAQGGPRLGQPLSGPGPTSSVGPVQFSVHSSGRKSPAALAKGLMVPVGSSTGLEEGPNRVPAAQDGGPGGGAGIRGEGGYRMSGGPCLRSLCAAELCLHLPRRCRAGATPCAGRQRPAEPGRLAGRAGQLLPFSLSAPSPPCTRPTRRAQAQHPASLLDGTRPQRSHGVVASPGGHLHGGRQAQLCCHLRPQLAHNLHH